MLHLSNFIFLISELIIPLLSTMGLLVSKLVLFLRPFKFQTTTQNHDILDHQKDLQHEEDRISELPDDLFIAIISHLPLQEVARNSVISKRWRKCWKVMTRLDFDSTKKKDKCLRSKTGMLNFVKWVNRIIDSHKGGRLQDFRICYGLDKHFKRCIDKWVRFAFSKQVECFDLEVEPCIKKGDSRGQNYVLTTEFVGNFVNRKLNGFKYLKALSFKNVNIDNELVELILNNSPALERLCIINSKTLSTIRVSGPQCLLKSLEVAYCLQSLEIYDVASLVSLSYNGYLPQKLRIKNVPLLTDLNFGQYIIDALFGLKMNDLLVQFSCSLKSLTIDLSSVECFRNYRKLPKFTALERLVVQTSNTRPYTGWYARFTKMCPSLREFVFQAQVHVDIILPDGQVEVDVTNESPHKCLKKVKILGYYGCTRDVEIVLYFIRIAVALETIVIDPRDQCPFFHRCASNTKFEHDSRIRATKQLKRKVPSRVKLAIL